MIIKTFKYQLHFACKSKIRTPINNIFNLTVQIAPLYPSITISQCIVPIGMHIVLNRKSLRNLKLHSFYNYLLCLHLIF